MSKQQEQRRAYLESHEPPVTLREYVEDRVNSLRELLDTHVEYLRKTLEEYKKEMTEKFLTVNEFRGTLTDQQKTFAVQEWVEARLADILRQVMSHKGEVDRQFAAILEQLAQRARLDYVAAKLEATETRYLEQARELLGRVTRLELTSVTVANKESVEQQFKLMDQRVTEQKGYIDDRAIAVESHLEAKIEGVHSNAELQNKALSDRISRLEHALSRAYGIGFAVGVLLAILPFLVSYLL